MGTEIDLAALTAEPAKKSAEKPAGKSPLENRMKALITPVPLVPATAPERRPKTTTTSSQADTSQVEDATKAVETSGGVAEPSPETAPLAKRTKRPAAAKPAALEPAPEPEPEGEQSIAQISLDLHPELNKRVNQFRDRTRVSYHALILDAVEATFDELPDLIAAAPGRAGSQPKRALFDRPRRMGTAVRIGERTEGTVRKAVKMPASTRKRLDELAEEFGAPSRNTMLVVAIDAYLSQQGM